MDMDETQGGMKEGRKGQLMKHKGRMKGAQGGNGQWMKDKGENDGREQWMKHQRGMKGAPRGNEQNTRAGMRGDRYNTRGA